MNNPIKEHNNKRKDLWIKAWCATVNANDCKHTYTATKYADEALKLLMKDFQHQLLSNLYNYE